MDVKTYLKRRKLALCRPQLEIINNMSHVLVAVAWPYANGPRHIGHVAGFGVPSDVCPL